MAPAFDRSSARRDTASFLLCVALSVTALFLPASLAAGISSFVRSTVLAPVIWLQETAERGRTSRARFAALVAQRDSAAMAALSAAALEAENRQLRDVLRLSRRLPPGFVPAEVLHQSVPTDGRTLLLGAGRRDGLRTFSPVLAPEGLLGVVQTVDAGQAVVLTWAHPEFRVSAFTEDETVFGIVAPAEGSEGARGLLELRGVPYRDSIPAGVRVVSSGLGGVYPQGIPVGTVLGVSREERGWQRTYLVRPAVNPLSATQVIVLTGPVTGSLRPAFAPDSAGP